MTPSLKYQWFIIPWLSPTLQGARAPRPETYENPINFIRPRFVQAIGVMAFAYVCHHNSFLIYASIKSTSVKR